MNLERWPQNQRLTLEEKGSRVSEDARGYVIKAELPQVKKEDVKITMEDGMLTITGERKFDLFAQPFRLLSVDPEATGKQIDDAFDLAPKKRTAPARAFGKT